MRFQRRSYVVFGVALSFLNFSINKDGGGGGRGGAAASSAPPAWLRPGT